MSLKTPRLIDDSAIVLPPKRSPRLKKHVAACALALLAYAPVDSFALELGEAAMRSGLGQSLLVAIPYRLAADEQLTPACIELVPARPGEALPTYSRVSRIAITPTHIEIYGSGRILEPLIGLVVDVHCATAPRFVRSYELFVDPPSRIPALSSNDAALAAARVEPLPQSARPIAGTRAATADARNDEAATAGASGAAARPQAPSTARADVSARARGQTGGTLAQGQTYVVVRGDTLSGIAARVADRTATIRETADAIFASNLDAFARGNPDLLQAGRVLTIPVLAAPAAALPAPPASTSSAPPSTSVVAPDVAPASPEPEPARASSLELRPPAAELTAEQPLAPAAAPPAAVARDTAAPAVQSDAMAPVAPSDAMAPVALDTAGAATAPRSSLWLTVLLGLAAALALSSPLLLLRRRKHEPAPEAAPAAPAARAAPQPRRLVDPVAGFDVVEGQLTDVTPSSIVKAALPKHAEAVRVAARAAVAAQPDPPAIEIGPVDSVDLDVGTPIVVDEGVDWFADAPAATAVTGPANAANEKIDATATARMPDVAAAVDAEQPLERPTHGSSPAIDAEQHTLTIVELDMLREDYEAEHTLTQAASKELRDAVADLKATQDARAETATLEIPQAEALETQPTQRLRSSR